ncbi:hypothetical protein AAVH_02690 [Aphelenchoides avenae]|nr:hypothetical protein AAVH_02690 [Aphelenchus avenae]
MVQQPRDAGYGYDPQESKIPSKMAPPSKIARSRSASPAPPPYARQTPTAPPVEYGQPPPYVQTPPAYAPSPMYPAIVATPMCGRVPMQMVCPGCNATVMTSVRYQCGMVALIVVLVALAV